jgi:hypothetical protein
MVKIFSRRKRREESEIDVLVDFLMNTANLTYVPNLYRDNLERALLLVKNANRDYVLPEQKYEFFRIKSATRYAIEEGVGFRIRVVDDESYRGRIGISSLLATLYNLESPGQRIRVGLLSLASQVEEDLGVLSLKMYREDAKMLLGPSMVGEKELVELVKVKLLPIPPRIEEEKPTTPELTPAQIEENLKSSTGKEKKGTMETTKEAEKNLGRN